MYQMDWDPDFSQRLPLFSTLSAHIAPLRGACEWPTRELLQQSIDSRGVSTASGKRLHLAAPGAGEPYEARIYLEGEMQVREGDWHDLFNVLAWLVYPRTKAALNEAHYIALDKRARSGIAETGRRGRLRDALTVFDESGVIVAATDSTLLDDLESFRWKRLFWERREDVRRTMRFHVLGHALFEKSLRPYVGMTGHAMLLPVGVDFMQAPLEAQLDILDALAAERVRELDTPRTLSPLPLLGVPGWWRENEREEFYDNAAYFRPGRSKSVAER